MTSGITQIGNLKKNTARIVGTPTAPHDWGPGGAALSDSWLEERLSVEDRPAHTEPEREADTELRVACPWRSPDSWMIESDLVFLEPHTGQSQLIVMIAASRETQS